MFTRVDIVTGSIFSRKELYSIVLLFGDEKNHVKEKGFFSDEIFDNYIIVKSFNFFTCMKKEDYMNNFEMAKSYEDNIEKFGIMIDVPEYGDEIPNPDFGTGDDADEKSELFHEALDDNNYTYIDLDIELEKNTRYFLQDGSEMKYYPWHCCLKKEREGEGVIGISIMYTEYGKVHEVHRVHRVHRVHGVHEMDLIYNREVKTFSCENDCIYC